MEVQNIPKPEQDINQVGGLWIVDVTIPVSSTSKAFFLPLNPIYAIGLQWTGAGLNPAIEFTFGSRQEIVEDTAMWTAWNKTAEINKAITAIRFINVSTLTIATAKIVVKGQV